MHSVPNDFWSWFSKLNAEDVAGLIAIIGAVVVGTVGVVCVTIYKVHRSRTEDAMKRELLDRGLSADEIATIVSATTPKSLPRGWTKG
jgi:hypothetical protein